VVWFSKELVLFLLCVFTAAGCPTQAAARVLSDPTTLTIRSVSQHALQFSSVASDEVPMPGPNADQIASADDRREQGPVGPLSSYAAQLPGDSVGLLVEPSIWERHRWRIVSVLGVFALQSALIMGLLYESYRRRNAEAHAQVLSIELAHANRVATAGELTASIAHEIRQPLAAIVVAADAGLNWLNNKVPELGEARKALKHIINEGHRADDVIRNIRAIFSKEETPRVRLDVNEIVDGVLALASHKLSAHQIRLRTDYATAPMVLADPVQLQQVIMNLVMNAIEAMDSVTDRVHVLQLKTETESRLGHVSITVEDSGPGIAPDHLEQIFKPFFTTKRGSMGLGLAICKSIIDAQGGRLTVAAAHPFGTTFRITLPLEGSGHEYE